MDAPARKKVSLTIAVDPEVLKRARIYSIEHGTTVNALLSEQLAKLTNQREEQAAALRALFANADREAANGGAERAKKRGPRNWTRADLYEERLSRYDARKRRNAG